MPHNRSQQWLINTRYASSKAKLQKHYHHDRLHERLPGHPWLTLELYLRY